MLEKSVGPAQNNISGNDLLCQPDPNDPLLLLSRIVDWSHFDDEFAQCYSPDKNRSAFSSVVDIEVSGKFV